MGVMSLPGSGCCWLLLGHYWQEALWAELTVSLWWVPARVLSLFQDHSGLLKALVHSFNGYAAVLTDSAPYWESTLVLLFIYEQ